MRCIALMVAIDKSTLNEMYFAIEIDLDGSEPPKNNPADISRMVSLCKNLPESKEYDFIDMYGIVNNGVAEAWEIEK